MKFHRHPPNYYKLLNVPFGSSEEVIKKNYRELAKKYHPDNKESGNHDLFLELTHAYKVLTGKSRSRYDRIYKRVYEDLETAITLPASRIVYTTSLSNLAKQGLMRKGLRNMDRKKAAGIFHDLDIFIKNEELNKKIRVNIPLVVRVLCPECQGSNIHCECCNGKGTYKSTRDLQITLEPELLIHKKMYELDLSHFRPDHFVHFKKKKLVFQIQVLG